MWSGGDIMTMGALQQWKWTWVIQCFNEASTLNVPPMLVVSGAVEPALKMAPSHAGYHIQMEWKIYSSQITAFVYPNMGRVGDFVQRLTEMSGSAGFCRMHSGELRRQALYKLELTPFFYCAFPPFRPLFCTLLTLHWWCEDLKSSKVYYHLI